MADTYVLAGKIPVKCDDLRIWAHSYEKEANWRRVAEDTIGHAYISTVFLGIDHAFGKGPPLLFETMVFGGALEDEQDRCSTWAEAEVMHARMLERVRSVIVVEPTAAVSPPSEPPPPAAAPPARPGRT